MGLVNYIVLLMCNWISVFYNTMNIQNLSKMLGHDSLHKGSSCEIPTLVDLMVEDAGWSSGAWHEVLE